MKGSHHAHFAAGAGYCVLNDLVAASCLLTERGLRVAIIDLDVHQGDGTIAIINHLKLPNIFILDLSAKVNFPFRKQECAEGSKALLLESGLKDVEYLNVLEKALSDFKAKSGPFDVVLYQAGVDPVTLLFFVLFYKKKFLFFISFSSA